MTHCSPSMERCGKSDHYSMGDTNLSSHSLKATSSASARPDRLPPNPMTFEGTSTLKQFDHDSRQPLSYHERQWSSFQPLLEQYHYILRPRYHSNYQLKPRRSRDDYTGVLPVSSYFCLLMTIRPKTSSKATVLTGIDLSPSSSSNASRRNYTSFHISTQRTLFAMTPKIIAFLSMHASLSPGSPTMFSSLCLCYGEPTSRISKPSEIASTL
jgi:hypothetical protein